MGNVFQATYIDVHEAAQSGHIDEVRRWVDEGKPVDARDNTQKTPLHHAAQWGQEEALDFLIECGADVNAADFISDTPLHLACYFGHANCARILIMVGANIAAKDCYGNTPSQIFDDHVTEPVLDEIRFIVREVMKGPPLLPEPGADLARPSSDAKQHPGGGSDHRQSSYSTAASPRPPQARKENSTGKRSVEGEKLASEAGATVEGATPRVTALPYTSLGSGGVPPSSSSTALQTGDIASTPADVRCPDSVSALDGTSDVTSSPVGNGQKASSTPLLGSSGLEQLEQRGTGRVGGDDSAWKTGADGQNADAAAVEGAAAPPPLDGPSGPGSLAPRLRLKLPWEDEASPEQASKEGSEGSPAGAAAGASGDGNASARMVGEEGTAATGLTYPGPRPLSAPSMRPMISASRLNATIPILSGRSYQGHNVVRGKDGGGGGGTLGASGSLGRTGAATLAERLVTYATRPGGSLDVFAAARDGQVSVLKQALTDGEEVDAQDENGLTALMWAARAGRLSTAKYLVSQGASLARRDHATGFSPLHFAAYYCRSSVVRVLVLAGADTQATDNAGKKPGERFQAVSYLSYKAFHHRRLIGRFLTGNMKDGMDDKGKTMFPKNSPLEAYDEEHRPQCVRLGSSDNLAISDQGSTEEDDRPSKHGSSRSNSASRSRLRSRPDPSTSNRRASADIARRAYATMQTMHSRVDDDSVVGEREKSEVSRSGGGGDSNPVGGVRYYLRRGSLQQVADKTREIMMSNRQEGAAGDSNDNRPQRASTSHRSRSSSRPASGGEGSGGESGVSYYLRRASLQGIPFIDGFLSGSSKNQDGGAAAAAAVDSAQGKGSNSFQPSYDGGTDTGTGNGDDKSSTAAESTAAATAAAATAGVATKVACSGESNENVTDSMEAGGGGSSRRDRDSVSSGSGPDRRERGGGGGEGGGREGVRRLSARILEGIQDGAKELAGQLKGHRVPSGDRSSVYSKPDVESGTRALPPRDPGGEIEPPALESDLGQREESGPTSQPQQSPGPQQRQQRHQQRKSAAGASRRSNQRVRIYSDGTRPEDEGGGGGTSSSLVLPRGESEGSIPTIRQDAGAEGITPEAEEHHHGDSLADVDTPRRKKQHLNRDPLTYSLDNDPNHPQEEMPQGGQPGVTASTPTPKGKEDARENAPRNQDAFSAGAGPEATPTILELEKEGAKDDAKARSVRESPVAVSPAGAPSAEGSTKHAPELVGRDEDDFVSQERKAATGKAPAAVVAPPPSPPAGAGEEEEAGVGSGVDSLEPKILSEDESIGKKKHGKSDRKSGSRRKRHHRKHRHHHRHRDDSDDEEGGDGRRSRRRGSRDRLLGAPTLSTTTALAPLKRVPPPSLSTGKSAVGDSAGALSEPSAGFGGGGGALSGDGGG